MAGGANSGGRSKYDHGHELAQGARKRVVQMIDQIPAEELVAAIKRAPSLRGMALGYVAEEMFKLRVLPKLSVKVSDIRTHDDHDRTKNKADVDFVYRGRRYSIQVKSIQTNSITFDKTTGALRAVVQNDGSDRRTVKLPGGKSVETTLYLRGEYDILAVPLFPFTGTDEFAYKRNKDCRACTSPKYAPEVQKCLIASTETITYPLGDGWTKAVEDLLDNKTGERV